MCWVCGDVIGVYEPLVVVAAGSVRSSSLAQEPALRSGHEVLAHHACGADLTLAEADRWSSSAADGRAPELG